MTELVLRDSSIDYSHAGGFCITRMNGNSAYFFFNEDHLPEEGPERHEYLLNQYNQHVEDMKRGRGIFANTAVRNASLPASSPKETKRRKMKNSSPKKQKAAM